MCGLLQTLNPEWNEEFIFRVTSFSVSVFGFWINQVGILGETL